jgi:hypothetical protein
MAWKTFKKEWKRTEITVKMKALNQGFRVLMCMCGLNVGKNKSAKKYLLPAWQNEKAGSTAGIAEAADAGSFIFGEIFE